MLKQYKEVAKNRFNRKEGDPSLLEGVVGHLTSLSSAAMILQEGSLGVRGAAVGQNAGGLSVINKPISDLGWLPFGPKPWRESIGEALWGSNAKEVVDENGRFGDKLEVLLLLSFPPELLKWLSEGDGPGRVDGRDAITIVPPRYLYGARDGHRYLGHQDSLAVLILKPLPDELPKPAEKGETQDLNLNMLSWEINAGYEGLCFAHKDPWVATVDGFLTPEECDAFIVVAGPKLRKREQECMFGGGMRRKDWQVSVPRQHTPKLHARIASLLNMDPTQLEKTQLIKYTSGGFFKTHEDGMGNRSITVFVYLNDTAPGSGATHFPGLGLTFQPKKGMAVLFPCGPKHRELQRAWDTRPFGVMRHEGQPILEGDEKHILVCIGHSQALPEDEFVEVQAWNMGAADQFAKLL